MRRIFASAGSGITKARGTIGSGERRIRLGAGGLTAAIASPPEPGGSWGSASTGGNTGVIEIRVFAPLE